MVSYHRYLIKPKQTLIPLTTLREIEKLIRDHKQLREREIKKGEIIVKLTEPLEL